MMGILYLEDAQEDLVWFHRNHTYIFLEGANRALAQFDATEEAPSIHPSIYWPRE